MLSDRIRRSPFALFSPGWSLESGTTPTTDGTRSCCSRVMRGMEIWILNGIAGRHTRVPCQSSRVVIAAANFAESRFQFEAAIRLDGTLAEARSAYATALVAEGHLAEAGAQYEAALRINPQVSVTHNNLDVLLFKLGDAFCAVREYQLAIAGRPGYAEAHYKSRGSTRKSPKHGGSGKEPRRCNSLRPRLL